MSDSNYVYRLYKAKCDCGTMSNYLNVVEDHGFAWKAVCEDTEYVESVRPYMNATDFVPKENITHFGRCNSETNKGNIYDKEEIIMCLLGPITALAVLIKNQTGCAGCKCKPIVSDAWGDVDDQILVNGVPIITEKSKLYCRNGGVITIEPVDGGEGEQ